MLNKFQDFKISSFVILIKPKLRSSHTMSLPATYHKNHQLHLHCREIFLLSWIPCLEG